MAFSSGFLLFLIYLSFLVVIFATGFFTIHYPAKKALRLGYFWLPLFLCLCGLIAGLFFAHFSGFFSLVVSVAFTALGSFFLYQHGGCKKLYLSGLFLLFCSMGVLQHKLHAAYFSALVSSLSKKRFFKGRVEMVTDRLTVSNRYKFRIRLVQPFHSGDFSSYYVDLFLPKQRFCQGDLVSLTQFQLIFTRPDFFKDNILGMIFPSKELRVFKRSASVQDFSCFDMVMREKERVCQNLFIGLSGKAKNFVSTIFLGLRDGHFHELVLPFRHWGISHYLARSGLHIVIFITLWMFLMLALPFSLFLRQLILLSLTAFYYLLSWSNVSFWRAFAMFVLLCCGKLFLRPTSHFYALLLTALLTLLLSPFQLFSMSFQFSFGLVFALFFAAEVLELKRSLA